MLATLSAMFIIAAVWLTGCGGDNNPTPPARTSASSAEESAEPLWRFVTGGWVTPREASAGALSHELRAFVITDQEQMDAYFGSFTTQRSRGNPASLARVDFPGSILLAAYYLWRPLQGEPLSFVGLSLEGNQALVRLELDESPQGKEYPYLLAPMEVVAVDRSALPRGLPIEFVFHLNGEPLVTVVTTLE